MIKDKTFVITGTLSKTRKEIESEIVNAGGIISSSVNKKLDYLVVGEEPGSKVDKAEKYGVKMISEDELREML